MFMLFFYKKKLKSRILNNTYCKGFLILDYELNIASVFSSFYYFLILLKKKTQTQLSALTDLFIFDNLGFSNRFTVIYSLLSIKYNFRLSIFLCVGELVSLVSSISIYCSACWVEREAWDLYGVFFNFNFNLSRILTDYGFKGHPLRKDFPLSGFFEIFYNDLTKTLVFSDVLLSQDYRIYSNHYQIIC